MFNRVHDGLCLAIDFDVYLIVAVQVAEVCDPKGFGN